MKQIAIITGYFITICIVGCLLAFPIYLLTGADFERIVSRTILILAVLLFYPTCKCLNVRNMATLGWVKTNAVKALTQSWALGFIMLLPISLVCLRKEPRWKRRALSPLTSSCLEDDMNPKRV